jgi:hypothetical protein
MYGQQSPASVKQGGRDLGNATRTCPRSVYVFAQFMSMILPNCVNIALKDLRSSVGFVSGAEGDRKG